MTFGGRARPTLKSRDQGEKETGAMMAASASEPSLVPFSGKAGEKS